MDTFAVARRIISLQYVRFFPLVKVSDGGRACFEWLHANSEAVGGKYIPKCCFHGGDMVNDKMIMRIYRECKICLVGLPFFL